MHDGKVICAGRNPGVVTLTEGSLGTYSDGRHNVVGSADTLTGVLALMEWPGIKPNVLVLDANLSHGVRNGNDARVVLQHMGEVGLNMRTVIVSDQPEDPLALKADAHILSADFSLERMVEVLDALPEPA